MILENIFYILISVLVTLAIVFLCMVLFYWIRILRNFSKVSENFREMGAMLKNRMEGLTGILTSIITIAERVAGVYQRKRKSSNLKDKKSKKSE